jgi:protein-L-isoaspartate(D-aspartate) O-methyltransferase
MCDLWGKRHGHGQFRWPQGWRDADGAVSVVRWERAGVSGEAVIFPELPPVDRRAFIPDDVWVAGEGTMWARLSRRDDPVGWERVVASGEAVTTKLKDGIWPVSSSSSVGAMADMIGALGLEPGMRVLEVGTGTGWNAACLAALGAEVVSVEIDAEIAEQARANLRAAGYDRVRVVTGDGERGAAECAPYDRVLSTAAVRVVPYAWVEQCVEGGLIVTPYTGEGHRWALLGLKVSGGVAAGSMVGEVSFMPLRGQGMPQAEQAAIESRDDVWVEVSRAGQRVAYARA